VKAYYCDHFVLPLPAAHSFPMAKYRALRERVVAEGLVAACDLKEPAPAPVADLARVHTRAYIQAVFEGTLDREHQRRIGFPWSPQMVERSRRSVGATMEAAYEAAASGTAVNLAGGTHHAFADRGEGYCVFNDVAVAARSLLAARRCERIAVIDCDVHQGNGTAAIFCGDSAVFTFSIHGEKNFPLVKQTSDLDIALPDGATDEQYLHRLEAALDLVFARHDPDFVFYVAGADPYAGDRLGRLALTIDGLYERDRMVLERCDGIPVVACMAGGYCPDIQTLVTIHANTVRAMRRADGARFASGTGCSNAHPL
jgi:acetoin utilization deacetylase AcuC-like enzyme